MLRNWASGRSKSGLGRGTSWPAAVAQLDLRLRFVIRHQVKKTCYNTIVYILSLSLALYACVQVQSPSSAVRSADGMQKIVGSSPVCTFFVREQNGLYAYVPVHTSMYLYVLVHTSIYKYLLNKFNKMSMYWYVPVRTSIYLHNFHCFSMNRYIRVHISYWVRKIDAAMPWYKGVHVAIHHIMESHAIVRPVMYCFILACPGV